MATITAVTVACNLTGDSENGYTRGAGNHIPVRRQPPVAESADQGVGVVPRRRLLARPVRERGSRPDQGVQVLVSGRLEQRSWETVGGERWSKVEIAADDTAASLRSAACLVIHSLFFCRELEIHRTHVHLEMLFVALRAPIVPVARRVLPGEGS